MAHRNYLRPAKVAEKLGIATGTLANWRTKAVGPPYYRINPRSFSGAYWVIAGEGKAMGVKLTKRVIEAAEPASSDQHVWDAEVKGFGLKITRAGRKVFLFQYRMGGRGAKTERCTIGEYRSPFTVDGARAEAIRLLAEVKAGRNPADSKRAARRAVANPARLFGEVAAEFIERHAKLNTRDWRKTEYLLRRDVLPLWASRPLREITRLDVIELVDRVVGCARKPKGGGTDIPPEQHCNAATPDGCRLADYAESKGLPIDFLHSLGLFEIRYQVSVAVKGTTSGGKSHLVERVLTLFPAEAFYALSSMSERALAYGEEPLSHRMLVIYEAAGLAGNLATYLIRSLLSEGRIRYDTVEKTKDGLRPRLIEREGPTGLLVTTTAAKLHPENETRIVSITVDDTAEQTRAILRAHANGRDVEPPDLLPWHALQTFIAAGPARVSISYALALADLIPAVAVRLRRDFPMLLSLISAHALLHQGTRERSAEGAIVATIADYVAVRIIVAELIADGVGATVSQATRETVAAVEYLVASNAADVSVTALGAKLGLDKSAASRASMLRPTPVTCGTMRTARAGQSALSSAIPCPSKWTYCRHPRRSQRGGAGLQRCDRG